MPFQNAKSEVKCQPILSVQMFITPMADTEMCTQIYKFLQAKKEHNLIKIWKEFE